MEKRLISSYDEENDTFVGKIGDENGYVADYGISKGIYLGWLYDDDFVWTVIEDESITVPKTVEWGLLSLFCLGDRAEGIDLTGLQYPLRNAVLTPEFPLGVSNHVVAEEACVTVRKGALAVGWELEPLKGEGV